MDSTQAEQRSPEETKIPEPSRQNAKTIAERIAFTLFDVQAGVLNSEEALRELGTILLQTDVQLRKHREASELGRSGYNALEARFQKSERLVSELQKEKEALDAELTKAAQDKEKLNNGFTLANSALMNASKEIVELKRLLSLSALTLGSFIELAPKLARETVKEELTNRANFLVSESSSLIEHLRAEHIIE